jgi:hypothetical protein
MDNFLFVRTSALGLVGGFDKQYQLNLLRQIYSALEHATAGSGETVPYLAEYTVLRRERHSIPIC